MENGGFENLTVSYDLNEGQVGELLESAILKADVGCRNTLFNGRAQTGAGSVDEFIALGLRRFRVELLEEDAKETARLVKWYREFLEGKGEASDLVRKLGAIERLGVTKGTLEQKRDEVHF